jgi:type IV pilus assembly protein PilA
MTRNIQKGFTLIELMIVIAIVAILVALAVPAYQDYTVRAKVGECIAGAAPAKLAVAEFHQTQGSFPGTADLAGIDTSSTTTYCAALTYPGAVGVIHITTANIPNITLPQMDLTPTAPVGGPGPITWVCTRTAGENRHVPSTCRNT